LSATRERASRRRVILLAIVVLALSLVLSSAVGAAGSYTLLVSSSSNRSNAAALGGATVSGNIFAFTSPDTSDITRVRFWLDNPTMAGSPRRTENTAPYDFAGGSVSTATPFDTRTIANGTHTITAAVDLAGGTTSVASATFTVQNALTATVGRLLSGLASRQVHLDQRMWLKRSWPRPSV
jgi:hypothetical protein